MPKELPDVSDYSAKHGEEGLRAEAKAQVDAAQYEADALILNQVNIDGDKLAECSQFERLKLEEAAANIQAIKDHKIQPPIFSGALRPVKTVEDYMRIDTENDPNCLLGRRWICKGGSFILNAPAGIGKSSAAIQMAVSWALGEPFFGIKPAHPLKSLFVQAENDDGDVSEQLRGVVNGLELTGRMPELNKGIVIVPDAVTTGEAFAKFARDLAVHHRPHLFFIDPLLSFLGGNVSDQETVSKFLRNLLNPIAQELGFAWGIIHHTNKPSKDPKQRNNAGVGSDRSYSGSGSAELANWARAVIDLREVSEGLFEFRAAKRGGRSGLTDSAGNVVTSIQIQHSKRGICWDRAKEDSGVDGEVYEMLEKITEAMKKGAEFRYSGLIIFVQNNSDLSNHAAKNFLRRKLMPYLSQSLGLYSVKDSVVGVKVSSGVIGGNDTNPEASSVMVSHPIGVTPETDTSYEPSIYE